MIRGKSMTESSVSAKVIRKDGKVEDLGVVSYWSKSWIKRLMFRIEKHFRNNKLNK